jgi:hypothetical protein
MGIGELEMRMADLSPNIPIMSGNTTPSGIASASGEYGAGYAPWLAFDRTSSSGWVGTDGQTTGWLAYDFQSGKIVNQYVITPRNVYSGAAEVPRSWTFEGWNGTEWEVLDSRTEVASWQAGVPEEFGFANTRAYTKYRVNVSENNGFPSFMGIGELEMKMVDLSPNIPIMSGNTTPSGIASASGEYGASYASWRAFDRTVDSGWVGTDGQTTGWLAYDFQSGKIVNQYTITSRTIHGGAAEVPRSWTFEGWNGTGWEVLDSRTGVSSWQAGVPKAFGFANTRAYTKYRINVSENNGFPPYMGIGELKMFYVQ